MRFDGENWTPFTAEDSGLPSNNILQIMVDAHGNKWIATRDAGLAVYREGGVILPWEVK